MARFCFFSFVRSSKAQRSHSERRDGYGTEGVEADQAEFQHSVANVRVFKPKELIVTTDAFDPGRDLGQGTFGRVYKGILEDGQEVAVKRYYQEDLWTEVRMLSCIDHSNLIKMIGYCDKGNDHIIVHEFMPLRSLNLHLHDLKPGKKPLDLKTRMKIAEGVAKALEYLHDQNDPPIIYAGWKKPVYYSMKIIIQSCQILIVQNMVLNVFTSRCMEGWMEGCDTVIMVVASYARPLLSDCEKFPEIADPLMKGQYPCRGFIQALDLVKMCVQEDPQKRPRAAEVMDRHFLCVVIRGTDACPYQVTTKSTVDELKAHVCSYWNIILPDSIQFVFDYEGRSNVVDSDVKLCSLLSLCIVNQLSFLEIRLFERVPLRAPDFVREPTTSEFSLAPDPSRAQLVNPCHLPSSSRMNEFRTEGVEADQAEFQHRVANVRVFKPKELMVVTDAFDPGRDLGQGTFGRVYKGILEEGQEVAVKRYDGQEDLWPEVRMLSCIKHPNLIKMIGYCDKGEEHIIVYEFMSLRSLNLHIHDLKPGKRPLDWKTRMKIAQGVAKALEYLHDQNDPPIIYAGWKNTGVLLDENYNPKLSNFECAKYGPTGDYSTLFSKLRYGYTAGSDICRTGTLTLKSDIYSFGIVLLELISGRKACDITKPHKEHFIHAWARPLLSDSEKFPEIADPLMKGQYPYRELVQALELAKMCVERDPHKRPRIAEAVTVLSSLRRSTH
ncbi:hypothetical protein C5167_046459 [Papaver somniferum]|uniref:Protein kinase domain-containing protein n=1 Tax=Papaver somniferum TaxID=3469 RepID=A0A4Y7LDU7_PAPSO|nr:hypothetical protein C5167_046459 [Papaver somniferum]